MNVEDFAGGAPLIIIICMTIGLTLIVCEIFRQTRGVVGGIGLAICISAIVFSCIVNPSPKDLFFIVLTGAIVINATYILKIILYKKAWLMRKPNLSDTGGSQDAAKDYYFLLNLEGTAITDIKTSGRITINDVEFDVVSRDEPIAVNSRVKVVEVEGRRIVVKAV